MKNYSLEKSPLFGIPSKAKLADLLNVGRSDLLAMSRNPTYSFFKIRKGEKFRDIEDPNPDLKKLQKRLNRLLSRIQVPEYVKSSRKGISYVDNAKFHLGFNCTAKFDIDKFFRSTKREYVFRCFHYTFGMPGDLAWLLTDLVTLDGHLPTGAPTSPLLAYWAYADVFSRMHSLAESRGAVMSLYVDDVAVSGNQPLKSEFRDKLSSIAGDYELKLKKDKTHYYLEGETRLITGCALNTVGQAIVPNKLRRKISIMIQQRDISDMTEKEIRRLYGLLNSARQIEPDFSPGLFGRAKSRIETLPV
ncbi:MAG: hypothetical protein COA62_06670 [Rhodobiaceae bacterium]|nr:MAG: hypothetical protein COA62_06670 [Rhodobiaceae bacterium]